MDKTGNDHETLMVEVSSVGHLAVDSGTKSTQTGTKSMDEIENNETVFHCNTSANPPIIELHWLFNGKLVTQQSIRGNIMTFFDSDH